MAFNIQEFRAQYEGDGARPNLFEVTVPFPAGVIGDAAKAQQKLTFMCHASALPESSIGTTEVDYFGRKIKLAGNRSFGDWTLTVYNDEDFAVRNAFEKWLNALNANRLNRRNPAFPTNSSYGVDCEIRQYDKLMNVIKSYNLIGAFPTSLSSIDLAWGNNDSVEEFTVTLAYQWWEDVKNGLF